MTDPFKTPLQKVMFYDKYSRYNHKKQRREVWTESVTRVMDFFNTHLLKTYGRNPIPNEVWAEIANAFANTDVMPSMRILQMAGPALERCHVGGYNCVSGETEYVTRDGIKTFTETVGTTQTVLCLDGQWRSAEVRQFGEALVNRVTLRPGRQSRTHLRKTVYATADHGWVTTRGHVRDLRVGDEVIANAQAALHSPEEWVRGFLFGDGTVQDGCARVRLCGKKVGHLPRFYATGARVSYPESNEGDPTVSWEKGRFADCKELPTIPHPSWMEGYLAADGGKQDRQPTLSTTREDVVEFVQRHAAELGIAVTGLTTWTKPSNYGDRQPLYKLGIRPAGQVTWRVLSIEPTGEVVPVYCVTEPVTHTFTLAHGLVSMNCAYLPLESPKDFADLLYILMQGTGVGFSVEDVYVKNWPKVSAPRPVPRLVVEIADTTESWCDAVEFAIMGALDGRDVEFDYSAIRPFGAPLKTKGGKASGPAPLRRLLEFIKKTIRNREGKQLRAIDLHDIACYCGQIVQVGGVRRAALISISDPQDEEMKKAKNGKFWTHHPQRMMANNTVAFDTEEEFHQYFEEEFTNLKESGTGERGLFFRFALDEQLPVRRDGHHRFGLNPCVTGDTIIATVAGPRTFKQLADDGRDVLVHAWHPTTKVPVIRWMRRPHMTRQNTALLEVEFDSGLKVRCTPDHSFYSFRGKKVQAKDLTVGASVRAWSMSQHRDGQLRVHGWDASANRANHQWVHRMLWEMAHGEIPEGMVLHHKDGDPTNNVLDNLELTDPITHNRIHYPERLAAGFDGHAPNHKVVAIREAGTGDVYNGCVDDAHSYIILDPEAVSGLMSGIVSANCGEIILRPRQFCNLSIAVCRETDTIQTLLAKVKAATLFGLIQSTMTHFTYIDERWERNCRDEHLLGVDITGQFDNIQLFTPANMSRLQEAVNKTVEQWSTVLQIPMSAATTCVKPSGNSAQLLNTSSGVHPRYAPYYIRTIRIGAGTTMAKFLIKSGVPHAPEIGQDPNKPSVWVFSFPIAAPKGNPTRHDVRALDQLEHWKLLKTFYTEHNPSCTIYVKPEEWDSVERWLQDNREIVGGLSFLPFDGGEYELAPYKEISKNDYEEATMNFPKLNFEEFLKMDKKDETTVTRDYQCLGDKCEL